MKKLACFAALLLLFILPFNRVTAQGLFNRIKQKAEDKVNQKAENTTGNAMDKVLNPSTGGKNTNNGTSTATSTTGSTNKPDASATVTASTPRTIAVYKNYDFVPGQQIILESQLDDERTGEIPSQFVLEKGQLDVQEEDGVHVIHVPKGAGARFYFRIKNAATFPAQFTVEFDEENTAAPGNWYGLSHGSVDFGYKVGNISSDVKDVTQGIDFTNDYVRWSMPDDIKYPNPLGGEMRNQGQWRHYAVAINEGTGKAYVDQYRVANVNNLEKRMVNIYFTFPDDQDRYIKNIRIAAGGADLYKKTSAVTRIVTRGIQFAVDQATIQPESMGTLNGIYDLLKKNPDVKFEIDGHTDGSGTAAHNLALSQSRAEAVKTQLVSMGMDAGRLTTKGYGNTKPVDTNDTPEGRANNRRVEFVKI